MGKVLFKGNEALAEAALAAGCRFYSGYPITPQTEILEYLSWRMEDVGGVFIQAESELAGVNMVLGASAAGARALTTSAGPGFSLKQEGISYLVAADLPAVIVDVNHSNSGKRHKEQIRIVSESLHSRNYDAGIKQMVKGVMIESYIEEGRQDICENLTYGKSITDPCLGWDDTERLLMEIAEKC